jgi:hypothetical protein
MKDSDLGHEEQRVYCDQRGRLLNVVGQRLYYEQSEVDQQNYIITVGKPVTQESSI